MRGRAARSRSRVPMLSKGAPRGLDRNDFNLSLGVGAALDERDVGISWEAKGFGTRAAETR